MCIMGIENEGERRPAMFMTVTGIEKRKRKVKEKSRYDGPTHV